MSLKGIIGDAILVFIAVFIGCFMVDWLIDTDEELANRSITELSAIVRQQHKTIESLAKNPKGLSGNQTIILAIVLVGGLIIVISILARPKQEKVIVIQKEIIPYNQCDIERIDYSSNLETIKKWEEYKWKSLPYQE